MNARTMLRLVTPFVRHTRLQSLALALLVCLLTMCSCGLSVLRDHVQTALDDSVALSQGGHSFAVVTTSPQEARLLTANGYAPVRETSASAGANGERLDIALRQVGGTGAAVPGRMVTGRPPAARGEVVLSSGLARALGAELGTVVEVQPQALPPNRLTVVGISVDPIAPDWRRATMLVDPMSLTGNSVVWVGDVDPSDIPHLGQNSPSLQVQPVHAAFGDENSNPVAEQLAALTTASRVVFLATFVLLLAMLGSLRMASHRQVEGLMACGATRPWAWAVPHLAWGALTALGLVTALLGVLGVQYVAITPLSALFGQAWTHPLLPSLGVVLAAASAVSAPLLWSVWQTAGRSKNPVHTKGVAHRVSDRRQIGALILVALGAAAALALAGLSSGLLLGIDALPSPSHGAWLGLVVVIALPLVPGATRRGILAMTLRRLSRQTRSVTAAVGVSIFLATGWALTVDRMAASSVASSPSDSALQVVGVPKPMVNQLTSLHARMGGTSEVYSMTSPQAGHEVLALDPDYVSCRKERGQADADCAPPNATTIVLDSKDSQGVNVPLGWPSTNTIHLVSGPDPETATTIVTAPRHREASERASSAGVVLVGSKSEAAHRARLQPATTALVVLNGYADLPSRSQAEIRSYLFSALPTAFPQGNLNTSQAPLLKSLGWTAALCSGILGVAVLLLAALNEVRGHRSNLRALIGLRRDAGTLLERRVLALYLGTGIVTPMVTAIATWLSLPHTGQGVGLLWIVPIVLTVALLPLLSIGLHQALPES